MKQAMESSESELALLRREIRRLKLGLAMIGLIFVFLVFVASASAPVGDEQSDIAEFKTIRAEKILLVDSSGRDVRHLGVEDGAPIDVFLDSEGSPRVILSAQEEGAGIMVLSPASSSIGSLMTGPTSAGEIVTVLGILDRASRAGWFVRQTPKLGLLEAMKDETETIRMAAHVDADGDFKFHVQKSELENVGEMIKWAGSIRSLLK